MVAEFTDVGEEACAIFRQRAGGAGADKNNTFRAENSIDGLLGNSSNSSLLTLLKNSLFRWRPIFAW